MYDPLSQQMGYAPVQNWQPFGMQAQPAPVPMQQQPAAPAGPQPLIPPQYQQPKGKYDDRINAMLEQLIAQQSQGGGKRGGGLLGAFMSYASPGGARAAQYMQNNRADAYNSQVNALNLMMRYNQMNQPQLPQAPVQLGDQYYWQTPQGLIPAPVPPKRTDDISEFEYGQQNPEFFDRQMQLRNAGAQNINIGSKLGPVPEGHRVVEDENGGVYMEPIPGKNPVVEKEEAAETAKLTRSAEQADTVLESIAGIKDAVKTSSLPALGTASEAVALYSESGAGKVRGYVEALKSTQVLDTMRMLKEASRTGATGMGATNEKEIDLMMNDLGSLNPGGNSEVFNNTLNRVQARWERIKKEVLKNKDKLPPELVASLEESGLLGGKPSEQGGIPSGWSEEDWQMLTPQEQEAIWKIRAGAR